MAASADVSLLPTQILDTIRDACFVLDADGRIAYVSPRAKAFFGKTREELLGQEVWACFPTALDLGVDEHFRQAVATGAPVDVEMFVPTKSAWFRVTVHPLDDMLLVYVSDTTAARRRKRRLRLLDEAVAQMDEAILITDGRLDDGGPHIEYVNAAFERMTGYTEAEVVGRTPRLLQGPETDRDVLDSLRAALDDGRVWSGEAINYRKDGTPFVLAWSVAPVRDPGGDIEHWVAVQRDVTDAIEQKRQLEEERQRLELALIGGDLGLWDLDLVDHRNVVSDRWAEMLGFSLDEVGDSQTFFEKRVHPDDLQHAYRQLNEHARGERPYVDLELRMRAKDGTWRWILDRGKIVEWTDDGQPRRAVGTHMDVTDRAQHERELQASKAYAERLIEMMQDGFSVIDAQLRQTQVNDAFCVMTGFDEAELLGTTPPYPYWPAEHSVQILRALQQTLDGGPPQEFELVFQRKDGTRFPVLLVPSMLTGEDGRPTHYFSTVKDITRQKERERTLIRAWQAAERAQAHAEEMNRFKSVMLANMSHELRTPLTSIIGFSELLTRLDLGPKATEYAKLIHSGGDRLLTTLTAILDLSELEAGSYALRLTDVDCIAELRDVAADLRAHADDKDIALHFELDDGVAGRTDRGAFRRIAAHVLSNAIKFTGNGGHVTLRCRAESPPTPDDRETRHLRLEVTDTGIGIDPAFQPHLFEAFQQESSGDDREFEGNGIGLAITRRLVDLLQGRIQVQSEKGVGTTVTVTLPLDAESGTPSRR